MTEEGQKNTASIELAENGGYTIISAKSPRWVDQRHSALSLTVKFLELSSGGEISFTASPDDSEPHGRQLYQRAISGEFGTIEEPSADFMKAVLLASRDDKTEIATARIKSLLVQIETLQDALEMKMSAEGDAERLSALTQSLQEWRKYRVLLGRVEQLDGFPDAFAWPAIPSQV